jgi:diketogulonate reductase-like aldo/keto reductase
MDDVRNLALPSGAAIPLLGFGTWQLRGESGYDAVTQALDAGYRHLDTATMYRNEDEIGRAVRDSGVPRSEVFITTKWPPDGKHPRAALDASLTALGVEQVDLWLIHWPPGGRKSVQVWQAFITARDEGLVRDIGVSNYDSAHLDELIEATGVTPAVNQIEWSPQLFDADRLADTRRRGIVLEGFSPFKAGNLRDATLGKIARAHGVTPAQVVLRWHLQHQVVVIPKSATPERIVANANIFGFSLTADEIARIDALGGEQPGGA